MNRKLKLLSPWSQVFEISGEELRFYSARQSVLASFATLAQEVAGTVSWYLKDPNAYSGAEIKTDRTTNSTIHLTMPASPTLVDHVEQRKNEHAGKLAKLFLDDDGKKAMCQLIVSSLRDEFPDTGKRGFPRDEDVQELMDGCDLATFMALSAAAIRANWRAVAEGFPKTLLANLNGKAEKVLDRVMEKMGMEEQKESQEPDTEQ